MIGTPAAIDAVPIVNGLEIAVVKPTPEAIRINEIAVKRDQFIAVHSIANTGYKIKSCSCSPKTADKIIITAVITQIAVKRFACSLTIIILTSDTSPPLSSKTLNVPPSTNKSATIISIFELVPLNSAINGEKIQSAQCSLDLFSLGKSSR